MLNHKDTYRSIQKWILSLIGIAVLVGSTSALFLYMLSWVTDYREGHFWLFGLLPFVGVFIVWIYRSYGANVQGGNLLILAEYRNPKTVLPLRMAPLIFFSTLLTHLFGGSAGREGTAIQYGASLADQFNRFFKFDTADRKILLQCGIAAGFASLFGTPWAGYLFALEIVGWKAKRWQAWVLVLLSSLLAAWVCSLYGNQHTLYPTLMDIPKLGFMPLLWVALAALCFGLTARAFVLLNQGLKKAFGWIKQPLVRPFIGGLIIVAWVYFSGTTRHIGLGIPTLVASFDSALEPYDFAIKILLTAITLCAGFKGGEVTPLFFIGATLGNALFLFIPLPLALLAAMGLVAVFSGCTKTPIACTIMGIELFGGEAFIWFAIACFISYAVAGKHGIYTEEEPVQPLNK
ncbi:chloride channel protein [Sphingobacterium sp. MYb382]|uniref:chloride channel protein n=1 Tax=Sphingobacterium sp. MYb382 TaxID=2745278 RepID=UPI00309B2B0E